MSGAFTVTGWRNAVSRGAKGEFPERGVIAHRGDAAEFPENWSKPYDAECGLIYDAYMVDESADGASGAETASAGKEA